MSNLRHRVIPSPRKPHPTTRHAVRPRPRALALLLACIALSAPTLGTAALPSTGAANREHGDAAANALEMAAGTVHAVAATAPVAVPTTAMPEGPPIATALSRPPIERYPVRACAFERPVCVHARAGADRGAVLTTLVELQQAFATTAALELPRPLDDGALGGDNAFDVYLVPATALPAHEKWQATARDAPDIGTRDRASAFALVRDDLGDGCARRNLLTRALVSAILWGQDAGENATARESTSAYLAELTAPCAIVTSELLDDFQAHPERSIAATSPAVGAAVALALPWYLDVALATGAPGVLPIALAAIGAQRSAADAWSWRNEPDAFDVLRGVLAERGTAGIAELWLDFAVARLFMGSRNDGAHFVETAFSGAEGRVRFDWVLPWATLPRRVSHVVPLEPTGATYIWIDTQQAEPGAQLAFRLEWEAPVPFRWALVRVDRSGRETSRLLVAAEQKSTSAEKIMDDVAGLAGVALVGVNVGDIRASDPFDPDEAPYEPHGFVVSVMRVTPPSAAPAHAQP